MEGEELVDFGGVEVVYGCELEGCGFLLGGGWGFGEGAAVEEGGEEFEDGGIEGGEVHFVGFGGGGIERGVEVFVEDGGGGADEVAVDVVGFFLGADVEGYYV